MGREPSGQVRNYTSSFRKAGSRSLNSEDERHQLRRGRRKLRINFTVTWFLGQATRNTGTYML